ncbi:MAG: KTSC domain-containing protein [Patescibacteria group bacterium]|nr:KTSC domain-containing protein [Patescibacteria group bacterium]
MTDWHDLKSGHIERVRYDEGAQELHVKFSETQNPYIYHGITPGLYKALREAPSAGQFLRRVIVPGRKVTRP